MEAVQAIFAREPFPIPTRFPTRTADACAMDAGTERRSVSRIGRRQTPRQALTVPERRSRRNQYGLRRELGRPEQTSSKPDDLPSPPLAHRLRYPSSAEL